MRLLRLSSRRGFTLVELVVAVLLIDVAVLALVAGSAVVVRRDLEVRTRDRAARAAANRLQMLSALPCASSLGDTALAAGLHELWTATRSASTRALRDSVSFPLGDARRAVVLETVIPC